MLRPQTAGFLRAVTAIYIVVAATLVFPIAAQADEAQKVDSHHIGRGLQPQQPQDVAAMSLPEALDYARRNRPSLHAARARIEVARRGIGISRAEWLPQLGATAQLFGGTMNNSTAMFSAVRTVDLPRIGATKVDPEAGWSAAYPSTLIAIGGRQMLFDFGRIAAQSAVAAFDANIASERVAVEQSEIEFLVETSYYAVLAAQEVDRAATDALLRAKLRYDMVKASVDRGLRPPIDLTRAAADLTRFEVGTTRSQGAIETAKVLFAAAVGVPETLLSATPTQTFPEDLPTSSDAVESALANDPQVRLAVAALLRQQALSKAILYQWFPTLFLTATIDGRGGGAPSSSGPSGVSGWAPSVPNWDVGVVLSAPIFDGILLARRFQNRAMEDVLVHELSATKRQLLAEIQRAYTSFRIAQAAKPALMSASEAAKKNYEQASARFKAGLGTSVELADAEALRTDAEIQLAVGRFDVARARAALLRVMKSGL